MIKNSVERRARSVEEKAKAAHYPLKNMPTEMWSAKDGATGFNCVFALCGTCGNRRNAPAVR